MNYSSSTNLKVSIITAVIINRKAISSFNSGSTSVRPDPLMIFSVADTAGISTGIQTGISRKESSKVFPSENITSPDTKEPANASPTAPNRHTSKRAVNLAPKSRFKKIIEKGIKTHSTTKSMAVP